MANLTNLTANGQAVVKIFASVFKSGVTNDLIAQGSALLDGGMTKAQLYAGLLTNANVAASFPLYTNATTPTAFVGSLVDNVFSGSGATTAYLDAVKTNWTARLNTEYAGARGTFMDALLSALMSDANATSTDATVLAVYNTINNRAEVGATLALTGASTFTTMTALQAQTATVTSDVATVATAISGTVTGSTFTLTTGVDNITGTSGNDTINAYIDAAAATDTFTTADVIAGGAGTDTLVITTDGNGAGALPAASISGVEVFSIREVGGTAGVYDFGTVSGETSVINRISTDQVTFDNLAAGTTLTIKGDATTTNGATVFTMAAVTDAATINIDGGTKGTGNISRNSTGANTVTINSTGAANTVGTIDLDSAGTLVTGLTINATTGLTASLAADYAANTTLTVTGAGAVDLTGATLSTNITTVTASAMTAGGLGVKLGANTTSFVGGAGNDTVYVDALVTGSSKTVAAGAGTADVLRLTDAAALTTVTAQYMTGFEVLRLADDNDGALDTFDMSMLSGLTSLQLDADSAGDGYSITNMSAAQAAAVTIRGTQAVTPTFGVTGATTVGQIDTLGLTIDDGATTTSTITTANLTAAGVEKVTVAMNDHLTVSSLTGMTALTDMTFSTTAKNLSVTSGALALNVNTTVDASAVTGTVTLDFNAATTNGASLKGSATGANTILGGVGADAIVGGTGIDTVTTKGAGADTLDFVSDSAADSLLMESVTGKITVTNFDAGTTSTTEDIVSVTNDTVDGGEVAVSAAAAQGALTGDRTYVITQTVGAAAALATGGTATLAAADFTAGTLTNVAAYLAERFTDAADNSTAVMIFMNNGTTTYSYALAGASGSTAITAAELTLTGVFTGAILNAADITQVV